MAHQGVVQGRRCQANQGRQQLEGENRPVGAGQILVLRPHMLVQESLGKERSHGRDEVRVDVARLIVQVSPAGQTRPD